MGGRVPFCQFWHTLIVTHQGNSQVKDCKIDLLTLHYEKFSISNEETIDSGFTRFNAIFTSLKSLDHDYSRKNNVRKFLCAFQLKWRAKSLALKAKGTREQTSDDSDSQRGSDEKVYEEEIEAFNLIAKNFSKDDALKKFKILYKKLKNLHEYSIVSIETNQGYSQTSKAYIVLNKETMRIKESLNVNFDESLPEPKSSLSVEDNRINEPVAQDSIGSPLLEANASEPGYPKSVKEARDADNRGKVDTSNALDASLVDTKSSGTELAEQDTSSRSGNDAHADDADIRPIYDEEPMAEVQLTAKGNVFATGQQHSEQPKFNNEVEVDHNAKQCHDTCTLPAKLTNNQTTKLLNQSLESENICLKKTVAQFQKDFLRMEAQCVNLELKYQNQALKEGQHGQFLKVKSNKAKVKHDLDVIETINIELEHKVAKILKENETLKKHYKDLYDSIKVTRTKNIEQTTSLIAKNDEFKTQLQEKGFAIAALKNELRKLTGNSVNTKFARTSILRKPVLQPHRNQSVVRQPTAFKSEQPRISKPWFASQVDMNNDLSKTVTTHYLPKEREYAVVKTHHVIASSNSRNSSKNMSRFSSNNRVHNHYLEEAKKKIQESGRNLRPSVMPSTRSQSTTNGSKPKPRINNQKSRNWPASKSSCITTNTVPIAEHSRISRNFFDSKHFVFSTCQKCVFNVNHDAC
ncbi:hypothetical protein Tco_0922096 [Tanacetum coccineum]|uniref:Retroviral polymerase SH3-like domain-containing protein n=1 Tax=Tanacetum coccineum TaxID=301880 RepID=A0ABQ5CYN8_9ASTR